MNSASPKISLRDLSDCHEKFDAGFEIYERALPASERKSRNEISELLARDDFRLTIAELDDEVIGVSIVYISNSAPISLLDYMATSPAYRNMGIGAHMFRHALDVSGGRLLFVEVESVSGSSEERAMQIRRQEWYVRLGCQVLDEIDYRMPQLNEIPPPPLNLMYHRNDTLLSPSEQNLREWISCIYSDVYGLDHSEHAIEAMLSAKP